MAKSFYDAHWKLTLTSSGYNHGAGHASQEEMRECLFELMRYSQEIRTASGEKVGPFETIDELSEFLKDCVDREEDHLLIREFEGGEARMVSLKKNGYVDEYSGKTISPEGYLNESAPGELKSRNAPRKPNGWDKFCDVIRGIFSSRDPAVKAYEDYQTRRSKFLSDHGFGKSEVMEVKDTDLDLEAPEDAEIYEDNLLSKSKENIKAANREAEDPKEREMDKIREILRPETFGYKPTKAMSDEMFKNMHGIADGDMPKELEGTRLGREFDAYRNFAQEIYTLSDNDKKMRDAFMLMSRSGKLGNLYKAFKNEFADDKKLNIKGLMEDALYHNKKDDLTAVLNNKKVAGRSFELPKAAVSSAK